MTSDSNSGERYMISAANRAPASGARKMAAMPAPMPAASRMRLSAGVKWRTLPSTEPKPAPIRAMGPSRPPEPPVLMVMALATSLMIGTRGRISPAW